MIVPIDSEHNAIFQCLPDAAAHAGLQRIFLTASGGPFRGWSREQLQDVTPAQAVAHPKWSMGPKISVDSATLMNKGLEVIEAHHLFGLPADRIGVLVHPQSLVHSLVEFVDGSTLAQLGLPDMRTALAVGLGWPERIASGVAGLDLLQHGRLDFEAARPRCLPLPGPRLRRTARRRHRSGGAERGQRSRGFSLSSGPDRLHGDSRAGRGHPCRPSRRAGGIAGHPARGRCGRAATRRIHASTGCTCMADFT